MGPVYLRFGRVPVPFINQREDCHFEIGKGVILKEGTDITVIANGIIINIHTIKPLDKDLVIRSTKKTGKIVVEEEHSIIGGLGSAVCDALSENYPVPVLKIGVNDVYGRSGSAMELLRAYELDSESLVRRILDFYHR